MFLEHNSNIVLEFVDIIMRYEHNVSEAYFVLEQIVVQITLDNDNLFLRRSFAKESYILELLSKGIIFSNQ